MSSRSKCTNTVFVFTTKCVAQVTTQYLLEDTLSTENVESAPLEATVTQIQLPAVLSVRMEKLHPRKEAQIVGQVRTFIF